MESVLFHQTNAALSRSIRTPKRCHSLWWIHISWVVSKHASTAPPFHDISRGSMSCNVYRSDQRCGLTPDLIPLCSDCYDTLAFVLRYLWPCDNFHVVHQPSEGGRHLVDDAMKQKLLCTMKHESSSHHQDGAVHLSFGFIRRCRRKGRTKESAKQSRLNTSPALETHSAHFYFSPQQSMLCRMALSRPRALLSSWFMMALFLER